MEQRFHIHKGVFEHLAMMIYWGKFRAFEDREKWERSVSFCWRDPFSSIRMQINLLQLRIKLRAMVNNISNVLYVENSFMSTA